MKATSALALAALVFLAIVVDASATGAFINGAISSLPSSQHSTLLFAKRRSGRRKNQQKNIARKARGIGPGSSVSKYLSTRTEKVAPFTPAVLDGDRYYLPAGTIVKHGTSTSNLRSILEYGLVPNFGQGRSLRRLDESSLARNAVYVASCYAAYGSSLYNCNASFGPLRMKTSMSFMDMMQFGFDKIFSGDEKQLQNMRYLAEKKYTGIERSVLDACGLPAVLNIKLQENVYIQADEDYVPGIIPDDDSLRELAGDIWDEFGTTAILQPIPASWIEDVECFEPDYRSDVFGVEKCLVLGHDVWERNPSVKKIIDEEEAIKRMSEEYFFNDMEHATVALSRCQFKNPNTRQTWQESKFGAKRFSVKLEISEVPSFLNHIERDGKINLLASGYHYMDMFSLFAMKYDLSISAN